MPSCRALTLHRLSCPADVTERAAIIAEGDGCSRVEADRRALAEHGQPSWQDLAERHRVEITSALERLPKRCTAEGTRLLDETRKFVASPLFDKAIALGWSRIELFGIAPDAPKTHLGTWGLIVTQVLLLRGSRIEAISEERAILWTRAGTDAPLAPLPLRDQCVRLVVGVPGVCPIQ